MSNLVMMRNADFDSAKISLSHNVISISGLGIENTQIYSNSEIFRTETLTNVEILVDFEKGALVSGLVLWGHNLSARATVQWLGYKSEDDSGEVVFDSGIVPAIKIKTFGELRFGVEKLGAKIFTGDNQSTELWQDKAKAVRIQKIIINDPQNPDGYIDIPRIYNGIALSPKTNFDFGAKLVHKPVLGKGVTTADGSYHTVASPKYRVAEFQLSWIEGYEQANFLNFQNIVGVHQDFYISMYPNESPQKRINYAFAAKFTQLSGYTHTHHNNYSLPISVREV